MKEVKYLDIRIGEWVFTVKLTFVAGGGFYHEDIIKARIMKQHPIPQTFFEKLFENWQYFPYDTGEYSSFWSDTSLKEWCVKKCKRVVERHDALTQVEKEWEKI